MNYLIWQCARYAAYHTGQVVDIAIYHCLSKNAYVDPYDNLTVEADKLGQSIADQTGISRRRVEWITRNYIHANKQIADIRSRKSQPSQKLLDEVKYVHSSFTFMDFMNDRVPLNLREQNLRKKALERALRLRR